MAFYIEDANWVGKVARLFWHSEQFYSSYFQWIFAWGGRVEWKLFGMPYIIC